jgi:hypothetical protein
MKIEGLDHFLQRLNKAPSKATHAAASALYREAEDIMAKSKRIVPFDIGTLEASGHVNPPDVTPKRVTVVLGYGGAAKDYAVVQHEHTEFKHRAGRQAKYLEQPMVEARSGLAQRLASRMKEIM